MVSEAIRERAVSGRFVALTCRELLQFLGEDLPEFGELRDDDCLAVGVASLVESKVVLVGFVGEVDVFERGDLGDDRCGEGTGCVESLEVALGKEALSIRVVKDCGTILWAVVVALTVESRWVVGLPEDFQELVESDDRWVKGDLAHLCVAGFFAADLLVSGVHHVPTREPGLDIGNAPELFEDCLGAPEAAVPKSRNFGGLHGHHFLFFGFAAKGQE